ncbi:hypothetical protein EHS25_006828 [Saitozyma podzolica]|uniref:Uncharacterized protein n=1 Tax=Saitozyma podzolica TaxID=1890683 RepID=A0A427XRR3_9TREE|nr:hypothetical protein EHS25_006828 [Saitozyma podzolica]
MLGLLYVIATIAAMSAGAIPAARDLRQRTYIPPSNITIVLNEYTNYFKKENSDELAVWGNAISSELIPNDEYMLNITFNTFAQVSGWQDTQPVHSLHDETNSPTLFVYPDSPYYGWADGSQGMVIVCGGS